MSDITPFADIWLEAKEKQKALYQKRERLIKQIKARQNRLASLQTTIENQINDMRLAVHSVDAELFHVQNTKDVACLDMLERLGGEQ